MHKLRLTCWPSPRNFTSEDDSHCSPYCLSFSIPHTLPTPYTTMYDHCKEYSSEWYRSHYGENWYETSTLLSIVSTPETSALIASQIRHFVSEYGPQLSDSSLPVPPFSLPSLQACSSSHWDNQSTASTRSYLSASDVPFWIPLPPEINTPWNGPTAIEQLLTIAPRNWNGHDDMSVLTDISDAVPSGRHNVLAHSPHQANTPPSLHTALLPITPLISTHAYTRADELLMHARMISLGTYQRRLRSIQWSQRFLCPPLHLHNYAYNPTLTPSSVYRGSRRYSPTKHRPPSPSLLVAPPPSTCHTSSSPYTRSTIRAHALSVLTHSRAYARPRPLPRLGTRDVMPHTKCSPYLTTANTRASSPIHSPRTSASPSRIVIPPCFASSPPILHTLCPVKSTNSAISLPKRIIVLISFLFLILLPSIPHVHFYHDLISSMPMDPTTAPSSFIANTTIPYTPIPRHTSHVQLMTHLSPVPARVWYLPYLMHLFPLDGSTPPFTLPSRRDTYIPCNAYLDTLSEYRFYYPP